MEEFEDKVLTEVPHPQKFWARYADDTGIVIKKIHEDELFEHVNQQHPSIKFTFEKKDEDQSIPMIDLMLTREENNITTSITENQPIQINISVGVPITQSNRN